MKFKMPRQLLAKDVLKIVSREVRAQKLRFSRTSLRELKEMALVSQAIERSGLPKYLLCKKLNENLGWGIFLRHDAKPLKKGQVIASYAGEISLIAKHADDDGAYAFTPLEDIHLTREEQACYDPDRTYHPKRLYCLKVDARRKGNFTRFINHSEKPNVVAYSLAVPSNPYGLIPAPVEIIYFAKKTIYPGEQLLVSYEDGEKSYWRSFGQKPFPMYPKTFTL
ncbi:MAG TPA: SET domain-containing protein [Rhabdochlamydiaceae bacterium]